MNWEKDTLDYYNNNSCEFITRTVNINMDFTRSRFTDCLPKHAYILDLGCGSGRDTKAFLESGYRVDAIDGSKKMCEIASKYTGIHVTPIMFTELTIHDVYDGIWACASLLHLPKETLIITLQKLEKALKKQGVIYASFKYGSFEGMRNGRYFTDYTEETLKDLWRKATTMQLFDIWFTKEQTTGGQTEYWINALARKV